MSETPAEAPVEEPKAEEVKPEAPLEGVGSETRVPLQARITPAPEPLTSTDDEASVSAPNLDEVDLPPTVEPFADAEDQKDEVGEEKPSYDDEDDNPLKASQVETVGTRNLAPVHPYVENEDFVPNPVDLYGFYDTSGAGTREDISKAYPGIAR